MNARPNVAKLQASCDAFNAAVPIGSAVIVSMDSGEQRSTTTRSAAEVLSGHSAVIWLDGIAGCYLLDRVATVQRVAEVRNDHRLTELQLEGKA